MTTEPKVRKGTGPDQLPQGAASGINETRDQIELEPVGEVLGLKPELQDMGERLFAPTDRPDEPLTEGLPFGPGSNVPRARTQDPRVRRDVMARELEMSGVDDPEVREFAERLRNGA